MKDIIRKVVPIILAFGTIYAIHIDKPPIVWGWLLFGCVITFFAE